MPDRVQRVQARRQLFDTTVCIHAGHSPVWSVTSLGVIGLSSRSPLQAYVKARTCSAVTSRHPTAPRNRSF